MNPLRNYDIHIAGLDNKRYEYDFVSDDTFFAAMDQELIRRGNVNTHLLLDKSETMIRMTFQITGVVELICDRCLDEYDEPVETQQHLLLKFGDHNEELSDEIELIERNTPTINVARYIFEFIGLALPMKRLHPRFRVEEANHDETEEGRIVYQSGPDAADEEEKPSDVDPRWASLRKLSDN